MLQSFCILLLFSLTTGIFATTTTVCNGAESLCSKLYSNVTFLGAHNSYAVGTSISDNQHYDVTTQLNDGVRLLQGQGHNGTNKAGSMIELCHSSCALQDGGTLEKYLTKVKAWVVANPREVLTILWVNSDGMPASSWAKAYVSTGLASYSYVPSASKIPAWPTLQALIDANTTVVNFMTSETDFSSVPYLISEWTNIWETPYDNTNYKNFTCELDRGTRPNLLYLANHFAYEETTFLGASIDSPNTDDIGSTNSVDNVKAHGNLCASSNSRYPNFFLVDFYEKGSGGVLQAIAAMNNVVYTAKTLGSGSSASAIQNFFGGQNEIRNVAIVVAAGVALLISAWVVICCVCRRKSRRNQEAPQDYSYIKPSPSVASSFNSIAPLSTQNGRVSQPKYAPLTEEHEMTSPAKMNQHDVRSAIHKHGNFRDMNEAFNDLRGQSRPSPTYSAAPSYTAYQGYQESGYGTQFHSTHQEDWRSRR